MLDNEILWVQKYRPRKIADTILPKEMQAKFSDYVKTKEIPNLLLAGPPGTGKTTVAKAMLDEIGADYIMVNGSLSGGIDTLRDTIASFASSVSMLNSGRKYVIIDEADYLTPHAQSAFRGFVEEYSANCGFILTCNFKNRIIEPIRESRFHTIDFIFQKKEVPAMEFAFFKRVLEILDAENITYEKKPIAELIRNEFPDFRKILNTLQSYAASGTIDLGVLANVKQESLNSLFGLLKEKNFNGMRKWVGENSDQDMNEIFRAIYEMSTEKVTPASMPGFIVTLGEYMYKHAFVADQEINLVAFLTEVMYEASFE